MKTNIDEKFMKAALKEAEKAEKKGEVPIGCVIVKDGKIFARAHNLRQTKRIPTAHAEILAIEKACKKIGDWRLDGADMYVTLEPCSMCAGAMVLARISRLVIGTEDPKTGACGSLYNIASDERLNHRIEISAGVLRDECAALLKRFFRQKRQ